MAWKANKGTDVLGSIAARLMALADLAEDVAGRSFLVRWLALWYIWQADTVVREFVASSEWNTAGRLWSPALPTVRHGTGSADAMALAVSLRALALIVSSMAAQRRRLAFLQSGQASGGWSQDDDPASSFDAIIRGFGQAAFPPVELRDTS